MSMELCSARSGTLRDSCFWFRIKQRSSDEGPQWLYMFVFCRQRQDLSLRRGGEQVSVVCISRHPFSSVLKPLSQVAGALFFSHGASGLDALYQESLTWPAPTMGLNSIEVGMTNIQALLPHASALPYPSSLEPFLLDPVPSSRDEGEAGLWSDRGSYYGGYSPESPSVDAMRRTWHEGDQLSYDQQKQEKMTDGRQEGEDMSQRRQLTPHHRHTIDDVSTQRPSDVPPSPSSALSSPFTSAIEAARIASGDLGNVRGAVKKPSPSPLQVSFDPSAVIPHFVQILPPLTSLGTAFCEVDVFSPLQSHLNRLWHIWELVLLAQPLMVVGLSPCDTSQTIAALLSLIGPLPFRPDFRPFLTIHDASFAPLSSCCQNPEKMNKDDVPRLFGITNLYFLKALESWPNVLSVGKKETAASSWTETQAQKNAGAWGGGLIAGLKATLQQKSRGAQSLLFEGHSESLWSSYRPLTNPDRSILARLIKPAPTDSRVQLASIASVNNEMLRRHFYELTTTILAPFSPYIPTSSSASVPQWSAPHFLASVSSTAFPPQIMDRFGGKVQTIYEFYARLLSSPNFCYWISQAQGQVPPNLLLAPPPLPAAPAPAPQLAQEEDEVTKLDVFFETEIRLHETHPSDTAEFSRLSSLLISMFFRLTQDLQLICLSSPARRNLLFALPMNSAQMDRFAKLENLLLK